MRLALLVVTVLLLLPALPGAAEIYRWTDDSGRIHFTQDLNQVPPRHRREAEGRAKRSGSSGPSKLQTYSNDGGSGSTAASPARRRRDSRAETFRIRVQRAGTGMMVMVRLNNSVSAPFLVDTGASDVLVPESVAKQLGLDLGPGARTKRYSTANGVVEHPVVMLRSVALGDASVENVPASVSPNMSIGLLGLSFFNHFTYNIDAAQGILTLTPNRLASSGGIRGGRSEAQWRSEFAGLQRRVAAVDWEFEHKSQAKSTSRRRLEEERSELERQLELLEGEADVARVPMAWRH